MSDRPAPAIEPETAAESSRAKTLKRDVALSAGDGVLASVALLRSAGAREAVPTTTVQTTGVETYKTLCAVVRERADRLREHVARETLGIATTLLAAKRDYERTTGTGHGKRNPQHVVPFDEVAAELVGKSARWVQDHVRIAERLEQDPQAVQQLADMADISLRLVLKFADERNAVRRLLALEAHRTSGTRGMRLALDGHPLARCAALFLDVKNSPYAQPSYASAILPNALVHQFPELAPYAGKAVGEVVAALRALPSRADGPAADRGESLAAASRSAEPPSARLLALAVRLLAALDVVSADIALATTEKEIARELAELRAELAAKPRKTKAATAWLPPEPGPDESRKLTGDDIATIKDAIKGLEVRAAALPRNSRAQVRLNKEATRLERRLQGDAVERQEEHLPNSDDEG